MEKQRRSNNIERDMSDMHSPSDGLHVIELAAKKSISVPSFSFPHQVICSDTKPVGIDAFMHGGVS